MVCRERRWMVVALVAGVLMAATARGPWLAKEIAYAAAQGENEATREDLGELAKADTLSKLFRKVAETVKPAVVEVRVTKWVAQPDMEDLMRRFFGERGLPSPMDPNTPDDKESRPPRRPVHGLGSGTIIDAEEGHVLTNYHVVAGADEVEVVLADNRKFSATWVRSDELSDIAVIKIEPKRLIDAPLGDSEAMKVGDWVLAIGAPRGLPQTVTAGIISAKGRRTSASEMYQDYLQTDAAINRGNSGGPLVNMRGEVIGVNNSIFTYSGGNEGIGFAVPSNMVRKIIKQLIEKGKVTRGYLGVRIQNVDENLARSFGLPTTEGALIAQVAKGGPAEAAKLQEGDFIVEVAGREIVNVNELRNGIAEVAPGETVEIVVYRDGKKEAIPVKISAQPEDMAAAFGEKSPRAGEAATKDYGLRVATLTQELAKKHGYEEDAQGVVITEVDPRSDGFEQGLRSGMLITHVGGQAVKTAGQFADLLAKRENQTGVRLRVHTPAGSRLFVFITPTKAPPPEEGD